MSGISGSLGYYLIGLQAGQGEVATSWYHLSAQAAPTFEPVKVVKRYTQTDIGRDQGGAYTSVVSAKGDLPTYLRPDNAALLYYLALGASDDSGEAVGSDESAVVTITGTGGTFSLTFMAETTDPIQHNASARKVQTALRALSTIDGPNVKVTGAAGGPYTVTFIGTLADTDVTDLTGTDVSLSGGGHGIGIVVTAGVPDGSHVITPSDDLPWFSMIRVVGGVITEQFVDCKMDVLKIENVAGEPRIATMTIFGIQPTFLDALPDSGDIYVVVGAPYMHYDGKANLKVDGVAQAIDKITWEFKNNLLEYQADDLFLNDIAPGKRMLDVSFGMHFTGLDSEPDYRDFMYGGGSLPTADLPTKPIAFKYVRDAGHSVEESMPQVRYAAVPIEPNPDGNPIEVEVATEVEKPDDPAVPIVTVTVFDSFTAPGALP